MLRYWESAETKGAARAATANTACNLPISQSQSMQETSQFHIFFVINPYMTFLIFKFLITGDTRPVLTFKEAFISSDMYKCMC